MFDNIEVGISDWRGFTQASYKVDGMEYRISFTGSYREDEAYVSALFGPGVVRGTNASDYYTSKCRVGA